MATCTRCGRYSHTVSTCFARTSLDGKYLRVTVPVVSSSSSSSSRAYTRVSGRKRKRVSLPKKTKTEIEHQAPLDDQQKGVMRDGLLHAMQTHETKLVDMRKTVQELHKWVDTASDEHKKHVHANNMESRKQHMILSSDLHALIEQADKVIRASKDNAPSDLVPAVHPLVEAKRQALQAFVRAQRIVQKEHAPEKPPLLQEMKLRVEKTRARLDLMERGIEFETVSPSKDAELARLEIDYRTQLQHHAHAMHQKLHTDLALKAQDLLRKTLHSHEAERIKLLDQITQLPAEQELSRLNHAAEAARKELETATREQHDMKHELWTRAHRAWIRAQWKCVLMPPLPPSSLTSSSSSASLAMDYARRLWCVVSLPNRIPDTTTTTTCHVCKCMIRGVPGICYECKRVTRIKPWIRKIRQALILAGVEAYADVVLHGLGHTASFMIPQTEHAWRVMIQCDHAVHLARLSAEKASMAPVDQRRQTTHRLDDRLAREPRTRTHLLRISSSHAASDLRLAQTLHHFMRRVKACGHDSESRLVEFAGDEYLHASYIVSATTVPLPPLPSPSVSSSSSSVAPKNIDVSSLLQATDYDTRLSCLQSDANAWHDFLDKVIDLQQSVPTAPVVMSDDHDQQEKRKGMSRTCTVCIPERHFSNGSSLRRHVRTCHEAATQHNSGYPCRVQNCTRTYARADELARHMASSAHSNTTRVASATERKKAARKPDMRRNRPSRRKALQTETKRTCQQCSRLFFSAYELRRHVLSFHLDTIKDHPGNGVQHVCTTCKRAFITARLLTKHLNAVTPCTTATTSLFSRRRRVHKKARLEVMSQQRPYETTTTAVPGYTSTTSVSVVSHTYGGNSVTVAQLA